MTRAVLGIALSAGLLGLLALSGAAQFEASSLLATAPFPLNLDLGTVAQGTAVTKTFLVFNGFDLPFGTVPLRWQARADRPWVSLSPSEGTITEAGEAHGMTVTVRVDTSGLSEGRHQAKITIESDATIPPATLEGTITLTVSGSGPSTGQPPAGGPSVLAQFDENGNNLIDDPEFFDIIDAWILGQIDDPTFFDAIDLWIIQAPIVASSGLPSSQGEGIRLTLNPSGSVMRLRVTTLGAEGIHLQLYDLAGREVLTREARGSHLDVELRDRQGRPLTNGVYLYVVTVKDPNGQIIRSGVRKLAILR